MLHLSRISTATLLAALCASALVGCASRSDKIAEHNKRVAAERDAQNLAMTARVLAQPLPLDNTLRMGPTAVLMVDVPAAGTQPATQARLFANCEALMLAMDYRQAEGWYKPFVLPADPQQPARTTAQQMCQAVEDGGWRQLPGDGEDILMVDSGSLDLDNARRSIWAGIDFARLRLEASKTYDRQLERVEINCSTQQANTRQVYRMSNQGLLPPPLQPLDSALNAKQRTRLVGAVCAEPAKLAKLDTVGALRKKLPPDMPTPEIPSALLAQVSALPQGHPTRTLSHLQFTYDATSPMAPGAVVKNTPMDLYLQPGPARGIWREQAMGALGSEKLSVRWRGLIELASASSAEPKVPAERTSRLMRIDLKGDWQNLKPGSAIGYSKSFVSSEGKPFEQTFECSVGESFPAAQKVASLQGSALNVNCNADNGLKTSSSYLYLEAYDLFVETADRSMLLVQEKTLKAAD
ncbi:hypothetical protein ACJ6X8_08620 [Pseudomonas alvandae]|jgi:hypothetical protein|uniref:hypothetical protein n=1 Tax=Pseudomonas TaxID=286 RepID=UPI00389B02FC